MKRFLLPGILLVFVFISILFLFKRGTGQSSGPISTNLVASTGRPDGYRRADGSQLLKFPPDYGPHPDYQTEWWYYTGNLQTTDGRRFGYQLTFFRRGLLPPEDWVRRESLWGTNQVYMAHFALSDIQAGEHHAFERFSRGAVGLAGAQADPYQVWLEDWQVVEVAPNSYRTTASAGEISLNLSLEDNKGPILHGDKGFSRKGPEPGNSSYYFSQTHLVSSGTIQVGDARFEVQGLSWMDHEFSTSALSPGQVGWDWFSIQLDDGTDLMVFQIRRDDGSTDPHSSGTLVTRDGETLPLVETDFQIRVTDIWRSPHTGGEYPAKWVLHVPSLKLFLEIKPFMPDQELVVSYAYWEGAVQVTGTIGAELAVGSGYVELTGYVASMAGEF